jgi:putative DNA primase/helicase
MTAAPSPPELAAMLVGHIEALSRELVGSEPTSRSRTELRYRRRGSLAVTIAGPRRGRWHDHEGGTGGDALGLVAHLRGAPMRDAYGWALAWLGLAAGSTTHRPEPGRPAASPEAPRVAPDTIDLAHRVWREGVSAAGTLAEAYLASRGLTVPEDAPLRFHPACPRGSDRLPAMVALMTTPETAKPCGVHRTFIRADGSGKAQGQTKMMAGAAGVIRLVPDEDVTLGLGLTEGIETALAVMQRAGWRPVWAASSAGAVRRFPVVPGIEALTIFADTGDAGISAAEDCAARWHDAGREARIIAPPAGDWDDATRRCA